MKIKEIRNWLGIYFTLITFILGGYILLFKETALLPIKSSEGTCAFEIIIPVLVGQLTIIFKWFGINDGGEDKTVDIPKWVVKLPPILVSFLIIGSIVNLIIGNMGNGKQWVINSESFRAIITFSVTLLNATTFFIISKFFRLE